MKEYLFSYVTIQKEQVQMELFGRTLQGSADILKGYRVATIEIRDEAFLSKDEQKYHLIAIASKDRNDMIRGTVFELTGKELLLADQYEPDEYKRIRVVLGSGKDAWIYAAVEAS
jgi:hypothetical protein